MRHIRRSSPGDPPVLALRSAGLLAAVGLVVLTGCRDSAPRDAGAVDAAETPGSLPELRVEELTRIGGLEGEEPYLFSTLADVVRHRDGRYFVADRGALEIRVFDAEGDFLHRFGREGEGPGELSRIDDLVVGPERIAVVNRRPGGRVAVFTLDGELLDDWRTTSNDRTVEVPVADRGSHWVIQRLPYASPSAAGEADSVQTRHSLHLLGERSDALGPPLVEWVSRVRYHRPTMFSPDWLDPLFRHATIVTTDPSGVVYRSPGHPYRVEVLDDHGEVVRDVGRDVPSVAIDESDYRELRRRVMDVLDTVSEIPEIAKVAMEPLVKMELRRRWEVPHADRRTVVGDVMAASDGTIWVARHDHLPPAETAAIEFIGLEVERPIRWEVFGPDGVLLGSADLPERFRATQATGRTLTGILRDDFDLEYVVTYVVEPQGG